MSFLCVCSIFQTLLKRHVHSQKSLQALQAQNYPKSPDMLLEASRAEVPRVLEEVMTCRDCFRDGDMMKWSITLTQSSYQNVQPLFPLINAKEVLCDLLPDDLVWFSAKWYCIAPSEIHEHIPNKSPEDPWTISD